MSPQPQTAKRHRLHGDERRQAIIDAAHSLFISKGYADVSVDEIVRSAGGSKSAVYKLFGNKEGLLSAVTESLANKMLSQIEVPRPGGKTLRESLKRMGLNISRLILSDSAISQYRLAIANLTVNPSLSQLWYRHGPRTTFDGFARYLKKEVANGRLRIRDCEMAAHFFFGMLVYKDNITMTIGAGPPSRVRMEKIVAEAVDVFLAAYGA